MLSLEKSTLLQPPQLQPEEHPLVSVIIPCYNHGNYLPEALHSVFTQTYPAIEIVVVDDGSTDNTAAGARRYKGVKYVYQQNKGLSAARNTGLLHSTGTYLLFLDADDLLYPGAIACNVAYLQQNKQAAFVSGAYDVVSEKKKKIGEKSVVVSQDHYIAFLKSNYIGMHATVLYRRFVFDEFQFDETLRSCEDYDLYLKIARKYPVVHHTEKLTAYRMHGSNMSGNALLMLQQVLYVLQRQQPGLSRRELRALEEGKRAYEKYYTIHLFNQIKASEQPPTQEQVNVLRKYNKVLYMRHLLLKLTPDIGLRLLNRIGLYSHYRPATGKVRRGSMNSLRPFSDCFGFDRGKPIDRYYIENFLQAEAGSIKGRVLEIGDNEYTLRFGQQRVTKSEILHVNDANPQATIIGDLSDAPQIEDNSFDTIILTQTLHLVYDYKKVIATCYRILKPGGVLLLTVPGITPVDVDEWKFLYSFTEAAIEMILGEVFPQEGLTVDSHGNVLVATAFLYGMAVSELKPQQLDYRDSRFQVIITAKAVK